MAAVLPAKAGRHLGCLKLRTAQNSSDDNLIALHEPAWNGTSVRNLYRVPIALQREVRPIGPSFDRICITLQANKPWLARTPRWLRHVVNEFKRWRISGKAPIGRSDHELNDILGSPLVYRDIESDEHDDEQPDPKYGVCLHAALPCYA
jgi:hypothetical protein